MHAVGLPSGACLPSHGEAVPSNTIERKIGPVPVTRKKALVAGSEDGVEHWTIAATLIRTAILNGVDSQEWLTDALEQIVSGKMNSRRLAAPLPWVWRNATRAALAAWADADTNLNGQVKKQWGANSAYSPNMSKLEASFGDRRWMFAFAAQV